LLLLSASLDQGSGAATESAPASLAVPAGNTEKLRVRVKGAQEQKSSDSIPWLLLKAKSNEGAGIFSRVTFIQRLDTAGGRAPAGACAAGAEQRVDDNATYRFFGP
jgi:hypothetical protein